MYAVPGVVGMSCEIAPGGSTPPGLPSMSRTWLPSGVLQYGSEMMSTEPVIVLQSVSSVGGSNSWKVFAGMTSASKPPLSTRLPAGADSGAAAGAAGPVVVLATTAGAVMQSQRDERDLEEDGQSLPRTTSRMDSGHAESNRPPGTHGQHPLFDYAHSEPLTTAGLKNATVTRFS